MELTISMRVLSLVAVKNSTYLLFVYPYFYSINIYEYTYIKYFCFSARKEKIYLKSHI
jgi:hypothetical protein